MNEQTSSVILSRRSAAKDLRMRSLRSFPDAKGRVEGVDVKTDFGATEGSARVERIHFTRLK